MEETWDFCKLLATEICEAAVDTPKLHTNKHRTGLSAQLAGRRRRELLGELLKGPVLGKRRKEKEVKTPVKQGMSPAPRPASSEKGTQRPASSQSNYSGSPLRRSFIREFREWATKAVRDVSTVSLHTQAEELWSDRCIEGRKWDIWLQELAAKAKVFPKRLAALYAKITPNQFPAETSLNQAIASITIPKLREIQRISKPSPEVEVTGLAFFLVIAALEGAQVLTLHRNAWKAFQTYLNQPGRCLLAIKRTSRLLESQLNPQSDLISKLNYQLKYIDEHSLKGVEGSTAAITLLRYLKAVLAHNSQEDSSKDSRDIPSPPLDESAESPDSAGSSRDKMLTSLYQRTFSAGNLRQAGEEDSPRLSFGDQDPVFSPYFPNNGNTDEAKAEDQMAEISLPSYSPHESAEPYWEKEEGAATARFPVREDELEVPIQRSKSSLKLRTESERQESIDPEQVWSRLIRDKMFLCGCIGQVLDLKPALLQEYRKLLDSQMISRVDTEQMVSRASDPARYREEVAKAHLAWEKTKVCWKPTGLNWTQQQIQRDKQQLERGIQRLTKRK